LKFDKGGAQMFTEFVTTYGLLSVNWGCSRLRADAVPLARSFTNTFAGIRPTDAPGFIVAQLTGAFAATLLFRWLVPSLPKQVQAIVFPYEKEALHGR
jgi:membrane protein DedA with SNARE-associated domain